MHEPSPKEMLFHEELGSLYRFDVRFNPADKAYCNPLPDGRVLFRVQTEPGCLSADIVYYDGEVHAAALHKTGTGSRFAYWETIIKPAGPRVQYSFAFKRSNGRAIYLSARGITHAVETQYVLDLDSPDSQPFETPCWVKDAIIYQIFPDRFANGNPSITPENAMPWGSKPLSYTVQGGDLWGVIDKLDYIQALGVTLLYLNPINASPSYHKYDASDYTTVDPAFGGNEALKKLVEEAHQRDLKVILDASFNHCHPTFFPFQDVMQHGRESAYWDWFEVYDWPISVKLRPWKMTQEQIESDGYQHHWRNILNFEKESGIPVQVLEDETDDGPMIEANYLAWYGVISMPKLNHFNSDTSQYFIDVATHFLTEYDIDGWRMDVAQFVPDHFWRAFRDACKAIKPDCILLSEIWGDTSHWLQGDMFDGTMNYLFRDLCLDYFASQTMNTAELIDGIHRLHALYPPQVTAAHQNLLDSHDVPRFLTLAGEDKSMLTAAIGFMMTMPGMPGLYYGDEIGLTGEGDPDNRKAFPWEDESAWDKALLEDVKSLIRLRQSAPSLKEGEWASVWQGENGFAYTRQTADETMLVVICRDIPTEPVEFEMLGVSTAEVVWGAAEITLSDSHLVQLSIDRHVTVYRLGLG